MNARRRSFIRKILYGIAIIPLLIVLSLLGRPATSGGEGRKASPGGMLAQLRTKENLDQSQWGEIDPAGAAIKLATFGMRGIATNLLWADAIEAKKKKDWTKLTATLNQVVKLQPNFLKVWEFQAWNLSYNCSAEFDDYRDRYRWVIEGIKFLEKGINYNKFKPRLYQTTGWTVSQKIGRADEHEQFRRLFLEDDEFHGDRPKSERDNWLVGKEWYDKAADLIDNKGAILEGDSPLVFRSKSKMCLMSYANSLEKDGVFGEKARKAWGDASRGWEEYGKQDIPTYDNFIVHLGELDLLESQIKKLSDELDALAPDAREKLTKTKMENLSDAQREAISLPPQFRNAQQARLAGKAESFMAVSYDEVCAQVAGADYKKANKLLEEIKKIAYIYARTNSYRSIVNYDYWKLRAEIEQNEDMLDARKLSYQAQKAFDEGGNLFEASKAFKGSVESWAKVLKKNEALVSDNPENSSDPSQDTLMNNDMLMTDKATSDDLDDLLEKYGKVLDQEDAMFPPDFPLGFYINSRVQQSDKKPAIDLAAAKAQKAIDEKNWLLAQETLETELNQWGHLLVDISSLLQGSDADTINLILNETQKYAKVLAEQGKPFPNTFVLRRFVWAQVEHDPITQTARGEYLAGGQELAQKNYEAAEKHLKQSVDAWRKVLRKYPSIAGDKSLGREMIKVVDAYRDSLEAQKKELPKKMPLKSILDRWGK